MAAPMFNFQKTRENFVHIICNDVLTEDPDDEVQISKLDECFKETPGSVKVEKTLKSAGPYAEKKSAMDQALRDVLHENVVKDSSCQIYKQLVTISTEAVLKELCSAATPFVLLSDIFDGITLDKCSDMFSYVEEHVSTWKADTFYLAGKNYLLRMCNDLLRRLSKSQNTLFCGRIQLFLARLFPLSEKSGLNLMSQFNLENLTMFSTDAESMLANRKVVLTAEESMDVEGEDGKPKEEKKSSTVPIDYNLYKKFWSLQDYFRKPTQCYEKAPWKIFTNYSSEVLDCFESYKLDDTKGKKKQPNRERASSSANQKHAVFAKYLTSEKLLDLQLSDSNFRRYVLVQFLVLFQYLQAQIRFKNANQVLNEEALTWVKNCSQKVYQLMKETPPEGGIFAKSIEHILNREENWNSWKNDQCPSFVRQRTEAPPVPRAKKRSLGDDMKLGGKLVKMGSPELTRLWNLNANNMEACSAQKRAFVPSLDEFFDEAIEQADPEAGVEEEYKLVNHATWSWKALRLLSRSSPHFFTQSAQMGKKMSEYLEGTITKLSTEQKTENGNISSTSQPASQGTEENVKTEVGDDEDMAGEDLPTSSRRTKSSVKKEPELEEVVSTEDQPVSLTALEALAAALQGEWKKLALELSFMEDEIAYWTETHSNVNDQALQMLTIWKSNEDRNATVARLRHALQEIGCVAIATAVLGAAKS